MRPAFASHTGAYPLSDVTLVSPRQFSFRSKVGRLKRPSFRRRGSRADETWAARRAEDWKAMVG